MAADPLLQEKGESHEVVERLLPGFEFNQNVNIASIVLEASDKGTKDSAPSHTETAKFILMFGK
jgi:hypothetical protein